MATNQVVREPNFFHRLHLVRWSIPAANYFEGIISDIARKKFAKLIELQVNQSTDTQENIEALKNSALLDFSTWLVQGIGRSLGESENILEKLSMTIDEKKNPFSLSRFKAEATRVFLENPNKNQSKAIEFPEGISLIANAIQGTALSIPLRVYSGKDKISPQIEEELLKILIDVDSTRQAYNLSNITSNSWATNHLYRQIAIADEYVWLALKPLITAPLADEELKFYARQNDDTNQLAYQLIKGDGVILITGYRGVGKSTFINETLRNIEDIEKRQLDEPCWKIVPIQMNVAKASNVGGVLRLCIRSLYRTFFTNQEVLELLERKEEEHLWFANLRASYNVGMSQAEALSKSRSLQTAFGFKPGDFLKTPLKIASLGFLPDLQYKTSKEWNEKMNRTISLLDYDEDRAEEDIIKFIKMLSKTRKVGGKKIAIKPVFVFDEMDKMEAEKGQSQLISQLKNLFLTRHAVFMLVTSKDFYYILMEDRKKEDSILSSYFSSVITVPLFNSDNTQKLLIQLLHNSSALTENEKKFVAELARYLTYRAQGLPREIIRELRLMQHWIKDTLQPYLTDRMMPEDTVRIYAELQNLIETIDDNPSQAETNSEENPLMRERIWLNKGRQEQIRRGLYILIEEILNQGTLTISHATEFKSYSSNFSTVPYRDFCEIFKQFSQNLTKIKIPGYEKESFFKLTTADDGITLEVSPIFYSITGRQIVQTEDSKEGKAGQSDLQPEEIIEEVNKLFEQDSMYSERRALNYLAKLHQQKIPEKILDKLYTTFMTSIQKADRIDAGKLLTPKSLYRNINREYPTAFLANETSESVLHQFLQLLPDEPSNQTQKKLFKSILQDLLSRTNGEGNPLPESLYPLIVKKAETLVETEQEASQLLKQMLGTINPYGQVPEDLLTTMIELGKRANENLALLLLDTQPNSISQDSVRAMLSYLQTDELIRTWEGALPRKYTPFGTEILQSAILFLAKNAEGNNVVLEWLQNDKWDLKDEEILKAANVNNPKLFYQLESTVANDQESQAYKRLQQVIGPVKVQETDKSSTKSEKLSSKKYENPGWLNTVLAIYLLGVYLLSPFQTGLDQTDAQLALGNFVQMVALVSSICAIICFLLLIISLFDKENFGDDRIGFGIALVVLAGIAFGLYFLLISWGHEITFSNQFDVAIYIAILCAIPFILQQIIRWIILIGKWIFRSRNTNDASITKS